MRSLVRFALPACGIAVLVGLAGCASSSRGSAASPASPSAPVSSTASVPNASASGSVDTSNPQVQGAIAAYRAMYADWAAAASTSDYQDPALARHASGSALTKITRALYIDKTEGTVGKGEPVIHPTPAQAIPAGDPTQVVVDDCFDDSNWLQYTTDGHLYNNVPGGRHKTQALVVKAGGGWKVDQLAVQAVGTC